ncbi:MAG: hypothetical protein OEW08_10200, partial [Gammaproteobacteria bacterium]|nr:hypothetical protein [Gammaproteobacteria bacterium]
LSENQQDITTTAIAESKVQYNFPHLLLDGAGFRLVWTQSHLPSGIARGLYTAVAAATQAWGEPVLVPGTRDSVSGGDFNAVSTDNGFMLAWTLNAMSTSAANVVVKRYDNTLGWGNTQGYHADFLPDLAPITALYQTTSGAGVLLLGPDTHDAINATVPRVLDISGF